MSTRQEDVRLYESRWSQAWERAECYRAPDYPDGEKFYNYDSGPFTNGTLHLGHVRTYVLGDVTARYQRAIGKSVLYCTEWDAFGLPIELEAIREALAPAELVRRSIGRMTRQLRLLGISYDYARIPATCDPAYYRWTQWLFLRLYGQQLIQRRTQQVAHCARCNTGVSNLQVQQDRCWRCAQPIEHRQATQWFVALSSKAGELLCGLDELKGWSAPIRSLVRGLVRTHAGRASEAGDWLISRQRAWGTPIPIVHCPSCGVVPVPDEDLPVRLPEDLDGSNGPTSLAAHAPFVDVPCPGCDAPARRETDTLDCFFDDAWCFLAPLVDLAGKPSFRSPRASSWMPVDRFHSGFDTVVYLHLHRFLALVLHERGELSSAEPISSHLGHEMVLSGGRKMSKHLGNTVSPTSLIRRHGADTVRLAMLWAAAPHSAVDWKPELLDRARQLIVRTLRLYTVAATLSGEPVDDASRESKAVATLRRQTDRSLAAIGRFIDDYRPNAAVEELSIVVRRIDAYARHRMETGRLVGVDARAVRRILGAVAIVLGVFAPHLAEEVWHRLGHESFVVEQRWPPTLSGSVHPT